MKRITILALLGISTTMIGCVSFVSDDTMYQQDAVKVEVNVLPSLTTVSGTTAEGGEMSPEALAMLLGAIAKAPIFGQNGIVLTSANGGGSTNALDAAATVSAALTGKGSATQETTVTPPPE